MLLTHDLGGLGQVVEQLLRQLTLTKEFLEAAITDITQPALLRMRADEFQAPITHSIALSSLALSQRATELLVLAIVALVLAVSLCLLVVLILRRAKRVGIALVVIICAALWASPGAHRFLTFNTTYSPVLGGDTFSPGANATFDLHLTLAGHGTTQKCLAPYFLEAGMCVLPHGMTLDGAFHLVCQPDYTRDVCESAPGVQATRCVPCHRPRFVQDNVCACPPPFEFREGGCKCPGNLIPTGDGGCICPPHFMMTDASAENCVRVISPRAINVVHIKSSSEVRWASFQTRDGRSDSAGNPKKGTDHGHQRIDDDDCISMVELVVQGGHHKVNRLRLTTYKGKTFGWHGKYKGHYVRHTGDGKCLTGVSMSASNHWFNRLIFGFHPHWE